MMGGDLVVNRRSTLKGEGVVGDTWSQGETKPRGLWGRSRIAKGGS